MRRRYFKGEMKDERMKTGMTAVSACLAGTACRYDGSAAPHPAVLDLLARGQALPVCPELLGGLPCPREACEIRDGRVMTRSGRDVTGAFEQGALAALKEILDAGCVRAILKARSPSCGAGQVYDGSFSGRLVPGHGLLAALIKERGIPILTEQDI